MIRLFCVFLTLALGSFKTVVFAQEGLEAPSTETTAATIPSDSSVQALDKVTTSRRGFKITYFGDIDGPSVATPTKSYKFDNEGEKTTNRSGWFHEPGLDYRLRQGLSLKVKFPFTIRSAPDENGSNWEPDDVTFGIANSSLIRTDNFNLYAGLNASPTMTDYSRSRQRTGEVGTTLIPSYKFGNSGFKLDWVTLFKKYLYEPSSQFNADTKKTVAKQRLSEFKVEFYPALLFAHTDKLSSLIGGHLLFMNNRGQDATTYTQLEDRAHVGLNYKFSQALTVRPEIRFKNPSRILAENTEAGMLIFGTIQ